MQTNWVMRCAFGIAVIITIAQLTALPVGAQQTIAETEIEQRLKFHQLTGKGTRSREQVIDELIDEKLKIEHARQWGMGVSDQEVDDAYAEMARRMNQIAEQLTRSLAQKGVDVATLKHRIRADLAWQRLVRLQYQRPGPVQQPKLRGPTGDFWWLDDRERWLRR